MTGLLYGITTEGLIYRGDCSQSSRFSLAVKNLRSKFDGIISELTQCTMQSFRHRRLKNSRVNVQTLDNKVNAVNDDDYSSSDLAVGSIRPEMFSRMTSDTTNSDRVMELFE